MRQNLARVENMKEMPWILVVDDDPAILEAIQALLGPQYMVDAVASGKEAQSYLQARPYDLVLTDMIMPEMGGLDLVKYLRLFHPETPVIVFTGYINIQDAVSAVKLGAFDYLTKPLQTEILRHAITRALEFRRLSLLQRDLEVIFQGAEALGWQALDLLADTPVAATLAALREVGGETDIREIGQRFLESAQTLVRSTRSSIFLYNPSTNRLLGLAALGPNAQDRAAMTVSVTEGIMSHVATQRRPLLIPDIDGDPRFADLSRRAAYKTTSFMVIPLMGHRFLGVLNLADREDGSSFTARDLFLGWLLGRLLVEILEAREPKDKADFLPLISTLVHEHLPLGLALLDQNLRVVQANPALERLAGFAPGSLARQEIFPHLGLAAGDREMAESAFLSLLADQEPREFSPLKSSRPDAGVRFLELKMLPGLSSREEQQGILLVEDISEREQLKQRLHLYEHLAIMGKLSLCVAHELNNPLDGIRRYLSLAQLKKDEPGEVERYLKEAQKGLQKMSLTIQSLLSSANPLKAPRTSDNLLNLLQEAVKIMMFQASDQRVEVTFHPSPRLRQVRLEGDIYHVFINVIKNALQAMPQGGHLKINGQVNAKEIRIDFEDTGPGLSSQELASVFEPFYSTKDGSQGLGLGLPICRKILERYQGQLTLKSKPGQGTRVRITLPKSPLGG
ncbi:MAG: response regulator [Thermodesulfobacteriota bacterium]